MLGEKDWGIAKQRLEVEQLQGWRNQCDEIPYIQFPASWMVRVTPPYAGATARFMVKLPDGRIMSVFLDMNNTLGSFNGHEGVPYWEVFKVGGPDLYPSDEFCHRCHKDNIEGLLESIVGEQHKERTCLRSLTTILAGILGRLASVLTVGRSTR